MMFTLILRMIVMIFNYQLDFEWLFGSDSIVLQLCHLTVLLRKHCAGKNSNFFVSLVAGCEQSDNLHGYA